MLYVLSVCGLEYKMFIMFIISRVFLLFVMQLTFVGILVGSQVWGIMADMYGRVRVSCWLLNHHHL